MSEPGLVVVIDGPAVVGRSTTLAGLQAAWPQVRSGPLLEVGLDTMLRAFGPGTRRWQQLVLPTTSSRGKAVSGRSAARRAASTDGAPSRGQSAGAPVGGRVEAADDVQVGHMLAPDVVDIDLGPEPETTDRPWLSRATSDAAGVSPPSGVWWGPLGRELVRGMHRAAAAWAHAGVDVAIDHLLVDRASVQDLHAAMDGLQVVHVALVCDPDVLEARETDAGLEVGIAAAQQEASRQVAERDVTLDTSQSSTRELVEAILVEVRRTLRSAD